MGGPTAGFIGFGEPVCAFADTRQRTMTLDVLCRDLALGRRLMPGDPTLRQEELLRPGGVDAFDNSLPVPEAFPYFDGYFIYPAPYFLYNEWWYPPPELVIIIDFSPWTVYGSHHEKTTDTAPYKYSTNSANGCNWGDTFNPM